MKLLFTFGAIFSVFMTLGCSTTKPVQKSHAHGHSYSKAEPIPPAPYELIKNSRPITFQGRRAGEGYFSHDGHLMAFQSERPYNSNTKKNPFYQIYLKDFKTQKTELISTGNGKTTCAWVHPNNQDVMFSSTHHAKNTLAEQKKEIDFRNSGQEKRYSWDYDDEYEIYARNRKTKRLKRLTNAKGYDAEGSYSPDGQWIAFASNRHAYNTELSEQEKKLLEQNSSYFLDIYIMKADGTQVKRLTTSKGYDGGPFFSPDGKRITWRRFTPDGHVAEIHTMNIDGSDQKKLTSLNKMSWAPFYHPSGDYLIFNTNKHGYSNFELYIVDTEAKHEPVRVSFLEGFDGLPVFLPNGRQLSWTRKSPNGESQIYMADWDDALARKLLELPEAPKGLKNLSPQITTADTNQIVTYLASKELKGRATGSPEEARYTNEIATFFENLNLKPAGKSNSYFWDFEFTAGVKVGAKNTLSFKRFPKWNLEVNKDWAPLTISESGEYRAGEVVFAGYGIVAPQTESHKAYDSYANLDVKDKWVMILRFLPEDIDSKKRQHLYRYSRIHHKVMMARHRGAKGVILVNGPKSPSKKELVELKQDSTFAKTSLPVITLSNSVAAKLIKDLAQKDLAQVQEQLNKGNGFTDKIELKHLYLTTTIDLTFEKKKARNVLALLKVPGANRTVVIGAHGDHLGQGHTDSSLMKSSDKDDIHYGADDNASGVAGVIELAQYFTELQKDQPNKLKQNIIFAVWSGEELGNLGSNDYIKNYKWKKSINAYLNMDMIGRYDKSLYVQGVGSSNSWLPIVENVASQSKISLLTQEDPYVPTDATSFYLQNIPVLTFFTGAHQDYHTPSDTAEKIDHAKMVEEISVIADITKNLVTSNNKIDFVKVERTSSKLGRERGFRIFLGTIPDYSQKGTNGVKISGVVKGGPAEEAGLKGGDVIVKLDEYKIENIYDYVYSLQAIKPNKKTGITVLRQNDKVNLTIVPKLKE